MTNWIRVPNSEGDCLAESDSAATQSAHQRLVGRDGFLGPSARIFHRNSPVGRVQFEGPLRPRAFELGKFAEGPSCPLQARRVLYNDLMALRYWKTGSKMHALARNADADTLMFVHKGTGALFCEYGHMTYGEGDYILIPRGTAWRLEPGMECEFMLIEAIGDAFGLPDPDQVPGGVTVDPMRFNVPRIDDAFRAQQDNSYWEIHIKSRDEISTMTYPYNPLDAQGWQGDLSVVKLNWRDLAQRHGAGARIPPAAYCTFVTSTFAVSTFVPKIGEGESGMLRVPFYHSNDDADEFVFYHRGEFFSRDMIHAGMATFHPCGFPHGPHPRSYQNKMINAPVQTEEVAVMIDSRKCLKIEEKIPAGVEWKSYVKTWENTHETL
ncbi:homogentisate 1,2-dioxygenase [Thalassospira sp. MA62]|nr:homogentisate 1,2-dioxygenase [Thalassospira sp. MA62]